MINTQKCCKTFYHIIAIKSLCNFAAYKTYKIMK